MDKPSQLPRRIHLTEENIGTKVLIGDNEAVIAKPEESVEVQLIVSLPDIPYDKIGIVCASKQGFVEVIGQSEDGTPICNKVAKYDMTLSSEDLRGSMCPHILQYKWYL